MGIKPKSAVTILKPGQLEAKPKEELGFVLSPTPTPWAQMLVQNNPRFEHLEAGQRVEVSPEAWAVARRVGELVAGRAAKMPSRPAKPVTAEEGTAEAKAEKQLEAERVEAEQRAEEARLSHPTQGGIGLIIDYGADSAFGSSFRAFRNHSLVPVFEAPGQVDLTVNVDFLHLKSAIHTTDARYMGPIDQADFLVGMGLQMRTERLVNGRSAEDEKRIKDAANRLVDESGMGTQYKVLGVCAKAEREDLVYPFEFRQ